MKKCEYFETSRKASCFGCGACAEICPVNAIQMKTYEDGFCYPEIDNEKCIECQQCRNACPNEVSSEEQGIKIHKLYSIEHKDERVLQSSQSGGAFTLLSDFFLKMGGCIYGAIYDSNYNVIHARAVSEEERDAMRMSKYVQSKIHASLIKDIKKDLLCGRMVLFTGTPCQVYMVKKQFGKYENLFTMEILCHGVTSPGIWKDYVELREKQWGNFSKIRMRNQQWRLRGGHSESFFDTHYNEHISVMYARIFYSHFAHRDSCYECPFANEIRHADITVGDFWDWECTSQKKRYALSMVFVNTEKGRYIFDHVKDKADYSECEISYFRRNPSIYRPISVDKEARRAFWEDYFIYGIEETVNRNIGQEIEEYYHLKFWD